MTHSATSCTWSPSMPDPKKLHQVAALTAAGLSTRQIEAKVGLDHSTVARAIQGDEARRLITQARQRIAERFTGIVDKYLDRVESGEEKVTGTPLMIQYGIAQQRYDDTLKLDQPQQDNRQLIIVIPGMPQEPITIDVPGTEANGAG